MQKVMLYTKKQMQELETAKADFYEIAKDMATPATTQEMMDRFVETALAMYIDKNF